MTDVQELSSPNSKPSSQLQKYYASLESRIGYYLVLGGTRHFGYYKPGVKNPFPINGALRRMEDHLYDCLGLENRPGAKVLDAGCGVGHVAIQMARHGLHVEGIDIVQNHVQWARQNIQAFGFEKTINARWMDYHDLDNFTRASFDGVYTMETLVHADDPEKVLAEFFRVMKPGGTLVLFEYEHINFAELTSDKSLPDMIRSISDINKGSSMPGNESFTEGVLQDMLEKQGFENIDREDLTHNIKPMVRLFYLMAYIPWIIICFLGLQAYFVNTQAGVMGYQALKQNLQRYSAFTAKKPLDGAQGLGVRSSGGVRERKGA